ncbi:MAG: hypothetical protein IKI88_06575 [Anaerotignum sp.]|nr:hypothetical protein [Anaerotignum sp.]
MKKYLAFMLAATLATSAPVANVFADDTTPEAKTEATEENKEEVTDEKQEENKEEVTDEKQEEKQEENKEEVTDKKQEETPALVIAPAPAAPAAKAKAVPSTAKMTVNGKEAAVHAYNVSDYTYFKLRDVAAVVTGTTANFEVSYDEQARTITLTKAAAYTGKADTKALSGEKTALLSNQKVVLDGAEVKLTAYNIDGYNYFKLRDLGAALGFEVTWNAETKTIGIAADELAPEEQKEETPATEEQKEETPAAEEKQGEEAEKQDESTATTPVVTDETK